MGNMNQNTSKDQSQKANQGSFGQDQSNRGQSGTGQQSGQTGQRENQGQRSTNPSQGQQGDTSKRQARNLDDTGREKDEFNTEGDIDEDDEKTSRKSTDKDNSF